MTKNNSLEDKLKNLWGRGYNAGYWNAPRKAKDRIYPEQDDVKQAKEEILQSLLSLIGDDLEKRHVRVRENTHGRCCQCQTCGEDYDDCIMNRAMDEDELRAELRIKFREWVNK